MFMRTIAGPLLATLAASTLLGAGSATADSDPGLLGSCVQRNDPLSCVPVQSAATASEVDFLTNLHPVVKNNDADLLAAGRRTCNMFIYAGQNTTQASADIGRSLKINPASATTVMNSAMTFLCPGLTIGPDGVPHLT